MARILLAQQRGADAGAGIVHGGQALIPPTHYADGLNPTRSASPIDLPFQGRYYRVCCGACSYAARSCIATAPRSILPAPLSGNAAVMATKRGCEYAGPLSRHQDLSSSAVTSAPARAMTMAAGTSPLTGCGTGATTAFTTSGCANSRFS